MMLETTCSLSTACIHTIQKLKLNNLFKAAKQIQLNVVNVFGYHNQIATKYCVNSSKQFGYGNQMATRYLVISKKQFGYDNQTATKYLVISKKQFGYGNQIYNCGNQIYLVV